MSGGHTDIRHRGRPAGAKREALSTWVDGQGRFTMGQAVRSLNWTMRDANDTIRRAIERGELTRTGSMHQPGCKRPVAVYARKDAEPVQQLVSVIKAWVR